MCRLSNIFVVARNYNLCLLVSQTMLIFAVCARLVANGDEQDEETVNGQRRTSALLMLCDMCPSYSLTVRSLCVSRLLVLLCILKFVVNSVKTLKLYLIALIQFYNLYN